MTQYDTRVWLYTNPQQSNSSIFSLQTFNIPNEATLMIGQLVLPGTNKNPSTVVGTQQICPGTANYTFGSINVTVTWDGTFNPSTPPVVSLPFKYWQSAGPKQSTPTYTPATCNIPNSTPVQYLSYPYPTGSSTVVLYLYNAVDTGTPQGYLMSSKNVTAPIPLYPGGYTSPSTEPSLSIYWDGKVTNSIPGVILSSASTPSGNAPSGSTPSGCTQLPPSNPVVTNKPNATLPNGGNSAGAPTPTQSPSSAITCIPITLLTYGVIKNNDTVIQLYALPNSTGGTTPQAILTQYPSSAASSIPLCNGTISPYTGLLIQWDGVTLNSSGIVVTYNCGSAITPVSSVAGTTIGSLPNGGATPLVNASCPTAVPPCKGNGGGGSGGSSSHAWIWWLLGGLAVILVIALIVALVVWGKHRHPKTGLAIPTSQ